MPEGILGIDIPGHAVDLGRRTTRRITSDFGGVGSVDIVKFNDRLKELLGVGWIRYEDLIRFQHEDNFKNLLNQLRKFTSYGLSQDSICCKDICSAISWMSESAAIMQRRSRNSNVKSLNDATKGFQSVGTRSFFPGGLTDAGEQLPKGEQIIVEIFEENERLHNDYSRLRTHPSAIVSAAGTDFGRRWAAAEALRLRTVVGLLQTESKVRGCKCNEK